MNAIAPARQQQHALVDAASQEIVRHRSDFEKMLGGAIGLERFERAVLTAIERDPDLLALPRDSIISAGLKAAQDRLLPDGREGVFLARWNSKSRRKEVTWAPMVYGIVKVAKQYAGVRSISCEVVYDGEPFRILLGDEMRIEHQRIPEKVRNGAEVGCYAIVTYADGAREREFMTAAQIEEAEAQSESGKRGGGPWKTWRSEMMRKTVIRRLSKKLTATDEGGERLRQVIERVDEDYNFGRPAQDVPAIEAPEPPAPVQHVEQAPWAGMAWPIRDRRGECQDFQTPEKWSTENQRRIEVIKTFADMSDTAKRKAVAQVRDSNTPIFAMLRERGDATWADEVEALFAKASTEPELTDEDRFLSGLPMEHDA